MIVPTGRKSRTDRGPALLIFLLAFTLWPCCGRREQAGKAGIEKNDYSAAITAAERIMRASEGETVPVVLQFKNTGKKEWPAKGQNPCRASYHLLDKKGNLLKFNNPRAGLSDDVRPGEQVEVDLEVKAPLEVGRYALEFDLLLEGQSWFKDSGGKTLRIPFIVEKRLWPEDKFELDVAAGEYTKFSSSVAEFEMLRRLIRLTLKHDEVQFPGRTGKVCGFSAGSGYPQIWLRDAATIIAASRCYYPGDFMTSWLEEHLAFQKPSGSLEDWIDARGKSDKNTVETDQEASAVQSAYEIFLLKGPAGPEWLEKLVSGEPLFDRLEKSLLFLFSERYSEEYGLLTGAHTADWGDVDPEDADQRAIYVDERTHWTSDIYDQAMAYEACRELAAMLTSLERPDRAEFWRKKAAALRENANRRLWQEDKGFYRVHIHLEPWPHDFDEDNMFPMGGNAQAVISGLADLNQARRIIEQALRRQKEYGVSTISGVLLPPYPSGFFKHPAMDDPYEYQNGGQWDWFGGRLVLAMFENGFSRTAREKLIEIIRKNVANGGLFEWDTREGAGRGSDYYAGSAGSLARALFEGYFGLKFGEGRLDLEPRLGEDRGRVHLYLPIAGHYAAYDYAPFGDKKKIVIRYSSSFPGQGTIKVLIPWTFFGIEDRESGKLSLKVLMDGEPTKFEWRSIHEDDFIIAGTDFRDHTLEIKRLEK
jgi:hypothetical protein